MPQILLRKFEHYFKTIIWYFTITCTHFIFVRKSSIIEIFYQNLKIFIIVYKSLSLLWVEAGCAKVVNFEQLQRISRDARAGTASSQWLTAWIGELAEQDITCVIASALCRLTIDQKREYMRAVPSTCDSNIRTCQTLWRGISILDEWTHIASFECHISGAWLSVNLHREYVSVY